MSDKPDNPPAFPACNEANVNNTMGMTLRDYFAGKAITICLKDFAESYSEWAGEAYALADAMLAERVK